MLAARSRETVEAAARAAGTTPAVTEVYGHLLIGTALLQISLAPRERVQCALHHGGTAGLLLADVWPGSEVRGRVASPRPDGGPVLDGVGTMHVSRFSVGGGEPYSSTAPLAGGTVGGALEHFLMESEQVLSLVSLAVRPGDGVGQVTYAGGLLVQALPDATREHLREVVACLERTDFAALVLSGADPHAAAADILGPAGLRAVGDDPLVYRCRCSRAVAAGAVVALGPDAIQELRDGGPAEEVTCEFCGAVYVISAADLDPEAP